MFTRILVPTDFSRPSDAALVYARELADKIGANLHILHVVDNLFLRTVLADPRDYEAAALRQLQSRVSGDDPGAVLTVERSETPADEIIRYAGIHDIGLIVMGTHGRGRMAHLLLGSVAEKVARTSPCPVLTLREAPGPAPCDGLRILVPVDFSGPADAALSCARNLAGQMRASIRLLHVIEHSAIGTSFGSEFFIPPPTEVRAGQMAEAQRQLSRLTLAGSLGAVVTSDLIFGPSGTMITAYAKDGGFDLIIMGTHGRSGLAHLLMGSIAASVIRTAPCPVLTVRAGSVERAPGREAFAACAAR